LALSAAGNIAIENSLGEATNDNVERADSVNIVFAEDTIAAAGCSIDLANITECNMGSVYRKKTSF